MYPQLIFLSLLFQIHNNYNQNLNETEFCFEYIAAYKNLVSSTDTTMPYSSYFTDESYCEPGDENCQR